MASIRINFPTPISALAYQALVLEAKVAVNVADQVASGYCVLEMTDGSLPRSVPFNNVPLSQATIRSIAQDIMTAIKARAAAGDTIIQEAADLPQLRPSIAAGTVEVRAGGVTPAKV